MYVDEIDISPSVSPANPADWQEKTITKTVSFTEPQLPAAIAIKGRDNNEILKGAISLKCNCTNPASKWNLVSVTDTGPEGWKTVVQFGSGSMDILPPMWWNNTYTGPKKAPEVATSSTLFNVNDDCGPAPTEKVHPKQGSPASQFWVLRKFVDQTLL